MTKAARKVVDKLAWPTFIGHAREDDQSSLSNAIFVQQRLKGPVETLILDDSYHMITLDRQRAMVVDRTVAFADGLDYSRNVQVSAAPTQTSGTGQAASLNVIGAPVSSTR